MSDKIRYVRELSAESRGEAPGRGRLQGRRILVVGGGQRTFEAETDPVGNGRAMSLVFAREGAHVAVADMNRASADDTVGRITGEGGRGLSVEANIAHEADVNRMIEEAALRLSGRNKRLTPEQALHLARHGVRQHADGLYRWKFDHYQRARAPYRLSSDDHTALWSRIACPTLLMWGSESFLPDPEAAGLLAHFKGAELQKIAGAGHWLHHDRLDVVLASLRRFLDAPQPAQAR